MQNARNQESDSTLLTYPQAAELLGLTPSTLYSMVCRRQVPHIRLSKRLVRFERGALLRWCAGNAVEVGSAATARVSP